MGCDIHPVVQRRVGSDWEVVNPPADMLDMYDEPPYMTRNYVMFGVLAGVRDHDVTPISEPRGLPEDVTGDEIDGAWLGEHSHSWLTAAEIADYDYTTKHYSYGDPIGDLSGIPSWLPWLLTLGDPDDVRIVFGFDS